MSERPTRELIRSLRELVLATKAVIASTDEGNNDRQGNTGGIENLMEYSLRHLFPNVRQSNPSLGSSSSSNSSLVQNPRKGNLTSNESRSFKRISD